MKWLKPQIIRIEGLLEAGDQPSLVYAALEARLAIERICYDRLRIVHDYISPDDLKRWQPGKVVTQLVQDVDANLVETFTLSISAAPTGRNETPMNESDFAGTEWLPVGTQVGFDAKKIQKFWQALSSFLHVRVPQTSSDEVSEFAEAKDIEQKVREVLSELRRIASGTLLSTGFGSEVRFICACGHENKRREKFLRDGQDTGCINPDCAERWTVSIDKHEVGFLRRTTEIACANCSTVAIFPEKLVHELPKGTVAKFQCANPTCNELNHFGWRLMQVKPSTT